MEGIVLVSITAWDCSAWVRTYALFLEERLECFRVLRYDTEAEPLTKATPGHDKVSLVFFVLRLNLFSYILWIGRGTVEPGI